MAIGNNIAAATTSLLVIIISIGLIPLFLDYQVESTGKVGVVVPGTVVVVRRLILEVTVVYPYSKTVRLVRTTLVWYYLVLVPGTWYLGVGSINTKAAIREPLII